MPDDSHIPFRAVAVVDLEQLTADHRCETPEWTSRFREKCIQENFAWLNRVGPSLSLEKQLPAASVALRRRSLVWSESFLLEVLDGSTT